jgi:hypothetical protein
MSLAKDIVRDKYRTKSQLANASVVCGGRMSINASIAARTNRFLEASVCGFWTGLRPNENKLSHRGRGQTQSKMGVLKS